MPKSRPIIFNSESIRAILDGRQTQTRRVTKYSDDIVKFFEDMKPLNAFLATTENNSWHIWNEKLSGEIVTLDIGKCPYGIPGDKLWVRETFFYEWPTEDPPEDYRECRIVYRATEPDYINGDMREYLEYRWSPSVHMPKWASRITLEIKDVRVERVRSITSIDATAEGIDIDTENFHEMWNSINAKKGYGWDTNPWVWVIEFEVMKNG